MIGLQKITLNFGAGKDEVKLAKGIKLLKLISGQEPVKTFAKRRIPTWGIRPGLAIGAKVTLRRQRARQLLPKLFEAIGFALPKSAIDDWGNISFGIAEYIAIPGLKYDPELGMLGLQVCITLARPGARVALRARASARIPRRHRVSKAEAVAWLEQQGVKIK